MDDNSNDERTIWCGNLSEKVTEEILYELFHQVGPLERVRIPKDRDGRSRQYGFVTFCHGCSVEYALHIFAGTCLFGREISMKNRIPPNSTQRFTEKPQMSKSLSPSELSHSDYIRGLSQSFPINDFNGYNFTLRNPYNSNGHKDISMLPNRKSEGYSNNKRKHDSHLESEKLKSLVNMNNSCPNLSYESYLDLGKQMLYAASMLQPEMLNSVQNSYYGTPVAHTGRTQNYSRHAPYYPKSERNSHSSNHHSDNRNNRSFDKYDRRSRH